jgi:hypothetical protein
MLNNSGQYAVLDVGQRTISDVDQRAVLDVGRRTVLDVASERSSFAARILLGRRSAMVEILGMAPVRMHRRLTDVVGVMRNDGVILMLAA